MRWNVQHRTQYCYASAARESFNQLRLQPMSTLTQEVDAFSLNVSPSVPVRDYKDFYANVVHYFEVVDAHESLLIESAVRAVTRSPATLAVDAIPFPLERIHEAARLVRCYEFLQESTYVGTGPDVWRLAIDAVDGLADTWQAARAITRFVNQHVAYASKSTSVHTHMREVLIQRKGVCQDLAHVSLGLCRALKIPALYVSGYLATEEANATHAWIEVFIPESGWHGLDPTHNRQPDETYLKIAVGRDYDDVAPVSGHYKGPLERQMEVTVQIQTEA